MVVAVPLPGPKRNASLFSAFKTRGVTPSKETMMKKLLLISTAALLISGVPAAFAQTGANPSGPQPSSTGGPEPSGMGQTKGTMSKGTAKGTTAKGTTHRGTTGMSGSKARAKGGQSGNDANSMGAPNSAVSNSPNAVEGRTGGGGGGSGR